MSKSGRIVKELKKALNPAVDAASLFKEVRAGSFAALRTLIGNIGEHTGYGKDLFPADRHLQPWELYHHAYGFLCLTNRSHLPRPTFHAHEDLMGQTDSAVWLLTSFAREGHNYARGLLFEPNTDQTPLVKQVQGDLQRYLALKARIHADPTLIEADAVYNDEQEAWTAFLWALIHKGSTGSSWVIHVDRALARFVKAYPETFEVFVCDEAQVETLAGTPNLEHPLRNCLEILIGSGEGYFREMVRAFSPEAGLHLLGACFERSEGRLYPETWAGLFVQRWTSTEFPEHFSVPQCIKDWIQAIRQINPGLPFRDVDVLENVQKLPLILAEDLGTRTPEDINREVATYCGLSIDHLHRRLAPERASNSGFLAPGDDLGRVIQADHRYLESVGVGRFELADRLLALMDDAFRGRAVSQDWQIEWDSYRGYQRDPFHRLDTFAVHGLGSRDFTITHRERARKGLEPNRITVADLVPLLIRRLCFFETGPYRLNPRDACVLLGLTDG